MAAYRVYCMDGVNRFTRTESIEAQNDDDAIRQARALMGDCFRAEVWERDRLVARLPD
jgi:hypothetical protein